MQIYDNFRNFQKKIFHLIKFGNTKKKAYLCKPKTRTMNHTLKEKEELQVADVETNNGYKLILYNDDYHTFDYVIDSLIKICKQTPEQAEQCTVLVHYKGKCVVKNGTREALMPMHQALLGQSLTSEIVQ